MSNPFINLTAGDLQNSRVLTGTSSARVSDYVVVKQAPKVITQSPAAGTPVLEGMTIEVKTVSFSDVPYHVLDATGSVQHAQHAALADNEKVILSDDRLKNDVNKGAIPENDRALVTEKLNAELGKVGLSGPLTPDDANRFVQQIGDFGFLDL